MRDARTISRLLSRITVVALVCAFVTLAGVQYARIVGRNLALAHELGDVNADVLALRAKKLAQEREIRKLSDPQGAISEIHDKLHLVGDREAIIYLKRHGDGS